MWVLVSERPPMALCNIRAHQVLKMVLTRLGVQLQVLFWGHRSFKFRPLTNWMNDNKDLFSLQKLYEQYMPVLVIVMYSL